MMNDSRTTRTGGLVQAFLREAPKMMSFAVVGVLNGVVNYAITVGLTYLVLTPLGLATQDTALGFAKVLGWVVAVSNSYVLNSLTTFAAESGRRLTLATYGRFVASGLLGLAVEVASFLLAVRYLPLGLAAIVPIGMSFIVNFGMTRLIVFPAKPTEPPDRP